MSVVVVFCSVSRVLWFRVCIGVIYSIVSGVLVLLKISSVFS